MSNIYENQKIQATEIYNLFYKQNIPYVSYCAQMQFGKTGVAVYLAQLVKENKISCEIITGMSSTEWQFQTKERFGQLANVKHRNIINYTNEGCENKLIIIDECQIGSKDKSVLSNYLNDVRKEDPVTLIKKNIRLLFLSATPGGIHLNLLEKNTDDKIYYKLIKVEPTKSYYGLQNMLDDGRIVDFNLFVENYNLEEICNYINKKYKDDYKYHLIRCHNGNKCDTLKSEWENKLKSDVGLYEDYDDCIILYYEDKTVKEKLQIDENIKHKPDGHTFIFIKERLRAAKTIDIKHRKNIGLVYERPINSEPDTSVVVQSLPGRLCGYYGKLEKTFVCVCDVKHVKSYLKSFTSKKDDIDYTITKTTNDIKTYNEKSVRFEENKGVYKSVGRSMLDKNATRTGMIDNQILLFKEFKSMKNAQAFLNEQQLCVGNEIKHMFRKNYEKNNIRCSNNLYINKFYTETIQKGDFKNGNIRNLIAKYDDDTLNEKIENTKNALEKILNENIKYEIIPFHHRKKKKTKTKFVVFYCQIYKNPIFKIYQFPRIALTIYKVGKCEKPQEYNYVHIQQSKKKGDYYYLPTSIHIPYRRDINKKCIYLAAKVSVKNKLKKLNDKSFVGTQTLIKGDYITIIMKEEYDEYIDEIKNKIVHYIIANEVYTHEENKSYIIISKKRLLEHIDDIIKYIDIKKYDHKIKLKNMIDEFDKIGHDDYKKFNKIVQDLNLSKTYKALDIAEKTNLDEKVHKFYILKLGNATKHKYKFGMVGSKRHIMKRLVEHNRKHNIITIVGTFQCDNGFNVEKMFKQILKKHNCPIIEGNEYFELADNVNINDLYNTIRVKYEIK